MQSERWHRTAGSSLRLLYDFEDWRLRACCCGNGDDPIYCCYFDDLRQAINELPRTH